MCEPNRVSIEEDRIMEEDEIIEKAVELLEKSVEEIENLYGRDTELSNEIRGFLNKQLGVDVWTEQMIAEANAEEE